MSDNVPTNLDDIEFGATMRGHQSGDLAFKRFALKRVLGRGGMGVVWLAEDTLLGREVALKFAPDTLRSDDAAIEELKSETRRGQDLAHPNIVRIFDFFLDDDHAAICMEYVDGDTLAKLRVLQPNKVFEPRQVARWVAQMIDGLSYAHRHAKIAHRDLKPPNLIINSQGDLKIMDFGIARSIQDSMSRVTIAGNSTGTLAYMSPQQAAGKSASPSDDIYSLGSTLYEMFTGKPPFYTGDFVRQIREDVPPTISERRFEFNLGSTEPFPATWEDVISRCLAKHPDLRPATVDEVGFLLGLGLGGQVPSLTPSTMGDLTTAAGLHPAVADTAVSAGRAVTVRMGETLSPLTAQQRSTASAPATSGVLADESSRQPGKKAVPVWLIAVGAALLALGTAYFLWPPGNSGTAADETTKGGTPDTRADRTEKRDITQAGEPTRAGSAPVKADQPLMVPTGYPTIQAALAAAKPGETVRVQAGTYEENVKLADGVSLAADPPGSRVLVTVEGKSGSALEADKVKTAVKISGLTFSHSGDDLAAAAQGPAVVSILSSNVTFENCVFEKGLGDGVKVEGSSRVSLTNCAARQNQGCGFLLARGAYAGLKKCQATSNGLDGMSVTGRSTAEAGESDFTRNQANGLAVEKGASLKAVQVNARENVLNGLYVLDSGTQASWKGGSLSSNGFVFSGNASRGTESGQGGGGLVAENAPVVVLENVMVEGNAKSGVQLLECSAGSVIRNCTVRSNPYRGIMLIGAAGQADITVEGNQCLGGGQHGITIQGAGFSPRILRNHCASNALTGIFVYPGATPKLEGNTFEGNSKEIENGVQ